MRLISRSPFWAWVKLLGPRTGSYLPWSAKLADEIWDTDDALIVRKSGYETRIPLTDIVAVDAFARYRSPFIVLLTLHPPCRLGSNVSFLPISDSQFQSITQNLTQRIAGNHTQLISDTGVRLSLTTEWSTLFALFMTVSMTVIALLTSFHLGSSSRSDLMVTWLLAVGSLTWMVWLFAVRKIYVDEVLDAGDALLIHKSEKWACIPLLDIVDVSAKPSAIFSSMFMMSLSGSINKGLKTITITLNRPCCFGSKIKFVSKRSLLESDTGSQPLITDLIQRINQARRQS